MPATKTCTTCATTKPHAEFYKDKRLRDGLFRECKACHVARGLAAYHAKPPEWREARNARLAEEHRENPAHRMWANAKTRAMNLGLAFAITVADIVVPTHCPALGIPLSVTTDSTDWQSRGHSPTLDRIIPSLGYVPGNVVVMSFRANRIKCDATPEELAQISAFVSSLT